MNSDSNTSESERYRSNRQRGKNDASNVSIDLWKESRRLKVLNMHDLANDWGKTRKSINIWRVQMLSRKQRYFKNKGKKANTIRLMEPNEEKKNKGWTYGNTLKWNLLFSRFVFQDQRWSLSSGIFKIWLDPKYLSQRHRKLCSMDP